MSEAKGKKFDNGKPDLSFIPGIALNEAAQVLMFGADKYGKANWKAGIHHQRLIASALRHLTAYNDGQDTDPESGLSHVSHALVNLMMLIWMMANRPELDNRDIVYEQKDLPGEDPASE